MTNLPQTDELPHADEGYDPARVEQAFATFADRVRELESVASELRAELHSLRSERPAPPSFANEDWPADPGLPHGLSQPGFAPSPDWVAAVPPPLSRAFAVPRLALEGAFLLAVAVLAGIADLGAAWIVLLMAVAWALVALAEWAAAAKRGRWRLDEIAPPLTVPRGASDTTGPWDMPVIGATAIEPPATSSESKTIVAKLPADPAAEVEPEPEPAPKRGLRLRRRKPADATAADPWEA
jgi:hypothetical protein